MSKSILNIDYRETLDAVDSYEEYLSGMNLTLDAQLWKKSLSVDNKMAYRAYLNKYPKGHYRDEAQLKINAFNATEEREEEAKAWSEALNKNTKASYEKYLMSYYNGLHKNEAKRKVDEFIRLEKEKELEEQRLRDIEIAQERIRLEKIEQERKLNLEKEKEALIEKDLYNFLDWYNKYAFYPYDNITNIESLKDLTELWIRIEDEIDFLPESIGSLKKLKKLYLPYNLKINKLPDSIGKLTNLIELNLNSSKLQSLPNSIGNLTKLESLKIDSSRLVSIPSNIFETLVNLKELSIYSSDLKKLPDSIRYLRNLKEAIFLWHMDIPKSFENLTRIEDLTIPPKALEKNPNLLKKMSLRKLTLVDESLTKMPKALLDLEPSTNIEWTYNNLNILENIKLRKLQASRILFALKNK